MGLGHDLVHDAPLLRLVGIQAASGEQHLHRDMIGNAARQLDGRRIGERAGIDFRQREGRVIGGDDDVGRDHDLEAAAEGEAVDRGDHRLVEAGQFLQAAEAADAIVGIGRLAVGGRLEIPARAEEFLARAGEDGDAQVRIVAELRESLAHDAARRRVDGIGLGPVDGDFEDGAAAFDNEG